MTFDKALLYDQRVAFLKRLTEAVEHCSVMGKRGAIIGQINTYTRTAVGQPHIVLIEENIDCMNELLRMHSGATALHRNDGTHKS